MDLKKGLRDESYSAYMLYMDGLVGEDLTTAINEGSELGVAQQRQLVGRAEYVFESAEDIKALEAQADFETKAVIIAGGSRVLALACAFQGFESGHEWCNRKATWLNGSTPLNHVANHGDV